MAEKARGFGDAAQLAVIMNTNDPSVMKKAGRCVEGFDEKTWADFRAGVALKGLTAKFQQNADCRRALLNTGNANIYEASPGDRIWGIGLSAEKAKTVQRTKWGRNLLGNTLIQIREYLRQQQQQQQQQQQ